jgi:hypothetical protein
MTSKISFPDVFWGKVARCVHGCWLWRSTLGSKGYGIIRRPGSRKHHFAHRVAYELTYGPIPINLCVLHKCDVRRCVNPTHLFIGTQADNTADMMNKGRHRTNPVIGSEHGRTHLTEADVQYIRRAHLKQRELAEQFGVAQTTISAILRRETWKHLET